MKETKIYPLLKNALLLSLLYVGLQIVLGVILGIVILLMNASEDFRLAGTIFISFVSFLVPVSIGFQKSKCTFSEVFRIKNTGINVCISVFITALGLILVISEIDNFVNYIFPVPLYFKNIFDKVLTTDDVISTVLLVVVLPGICEELFFRGLLLTGLSKKYKSYAAILISALLFGFVHLNPWQFVSAFIIGIYLAWLCLKTGSIFLCMFVHFMNNGIYLYVVKKGVHLKGFNTNFKYPVEFQNLWVDLAGIVLLFSGIALTVLFLRNKNQVSADS